MTLSSFSSSESTTLPVNNIFASVRNLIHSLTVATSSFIADIVVTYDSFLQTCSDQTSVRTAVNTINGYLTSCGVPIESLLTTEEFVLSLLTILFTLITYYFVMGKNHVRKRKRLAEDLKIAQAKVHYLEEKLMLVLSEHDRQQLLGGKKDRPIRIFMDGAFDLMHYGHMNAFRLARSLGTYLVVGVNSDESITACKGPPLMNDMERLTMVSGCKFVDEVVPGCPYVMNEKYVNYVIQKYKIDYVVHGDDPCIVDGKDVYEAAKKAGKYQSIPRTEGVSTTDIVGRMLVMSKDHHHSTHSSHSNGSHSQNNNNNNNNNGTSTFRRDDSTWLCSQSKFLTTSRMLRLFSAGMKSPERGMRVIYVDGAWDMFHCGHVALLKEAKQRGEYLIVGIHGDALVNRILGANLPLMNLHERVLSVLGCRFVDDVLIDAPWIISPEMVASLNIAEVVHGSNTDYDVDFSTGSTSHSDGHEDDGVLPSLEERYQFVKEMGIYQDITSPTDFNLSSILNRIQANHQMFQVKIAKKKKAESDFYKEKYKL